MLIRNCARYIRTKLVNSESLPRDWVDSRIDLNNLVEVAAYEFDETMQTMFVDDGVVGRVSSRKPVINSEI